MVSLKSDFPIFHHRPSMVYVDSASTSQKPSYVIDHVCQYLRQSNSNIHRGMYDIAVDSEQAYQHSKTLIASLVGTSPSRIISTSNATMGYNLLAQSLWESHILSRGDHVLVSIAEHHANIVPRQMLADRHGIIIDRLGITSDGQLDYDKIPSLLTDRTQVVSLTGCSNVLGICSDIVRIRQLIGHRYLVIDGSQIIPHQYVDMQLGSIDALIWTGHKMMGLTGVGIVALSDRLQNVLNPVRGGGDMIADVTTQGYDLQHSVQKFEPGTPSIVSLLSLGYACEYMQTIGGYDQITKIESDFACQLNGIFRAHQDHVHCLGDLDDHSRHIWSFVVDGWTSIRVAEWCADHDICIRFGGHCAHPLVRHLGYGDGGLCRISSYLYQDDHDLQMIADMFHDLKRGL